MAARMLIIRAVLILCVCLNILCLWELVYVSDQELLTSDCDKWPQTLAERRRTASCLSIHRLRDGNSGTRRGSTTAVAVYPRSLCAVRSLSAFSGFSGCAGICCI